MKPREYEKGDVLIDLAGGECANGERIHLKHGEACWFSVDEYGIASIVFYTHTRFLKKKIRHEIMLQKGDQWCLIAGSKPGAGIQMTEAEE